MLLFSLRGIHRIPLFSLPHSLHPLLLIYPFAKNELDRKLVGSFSLCGVKISWYFRGRI